MGVIRTGSMQFIPQSVQSSWVHMRIFMMLVVTLGIFWAFDAYVYKSHFFDQAWREIRQQSNKITEDVRYWLKNEGR
jgi:uncharacterized membrane protein YqhA